MKLDRLIEDLQAIQEDLKESGVDTAETEVLAGIQPTYPLTQIVIGAVSGEVLHDEVEYGIGEPERKAVWLAASSPGPSSYNPYAPKALWEVAR